MTKPITPLKKRYLHGKAQRMSSMKALSFALLMSMGYVTVNASPDYFTGASTPASYEKLSRNQFKADVPIRGTVKDETTCWIRRMGWIIE